MAAETRSRKACCLVSEILEDAGLDRQKVRALQRQLLQGVILFCQWQLERIERPAPEGGPRRKRAQRVAVE